MKCDKILLIDDDEDDQLIFKDIIGEIAGAPGCVFAKNGLEALSLLKTLQPLPCIIFLDLNMPYISGFECLEKIRQDETLNGVPVVIFTTSSNPADRLKAKGLGANNYLTKTSDLTLLRGMLHQLVGGGF